MSFNFVKELKQEEKKVIKMTLRAYYIDENEDGNLIYKFTFNVKNLFTIGWSNENGDFAVKVFEDDVSAISIYINKNHGNWLEWTPRFLDYIGFDEENYLKNKTKKQIIDDLKEEYEKVIILKKEPKITKKFMKEHEEYIWDKFNEDTIVSSFYAQYYDNQLFWDNIIDTYIDWDDYSILAIVSPEGVREESGVV